MKATYVSVWDGGIDIRTNCEYDPITKDVTDIESVDVGGLEVLEGEYIELPDGTVIDRKDYSIDGVWVDEEESNSVDL